MTGVDCFLIHHHRDRGVVAMVMERCVIQEFTGVVVALHIIQRPVVAVVVAVVVEDDFLEVIIVEYDILKVVIVEDDALDIIVVVVVIE